MRSYIEVLGAGTADAAAGLLLFFDDARYLFECGDGVQRFCTERPIKLGRLRAICLTSLAAPSVGGLFGMVLTVADAGMSNVTIAAPAGLSQVVSAAQRGCFFHRPSMQTKLVDVPPVSAKPHVIIDDSNVRISAVPIVPDAAPGATSSSKSLCYICRLHDVVGKFNPVKAATLGVPKGPDYGTLKKGIPVTLAGGTVIQPSSVVSPSTPGPLVLIVACPSVNHIPGVTSNSSLDPQSLGLVDAAGAPLSSAPSCVLYHLTSRAVLAHPDYLSWCRRFSPSTTHITLHSSLAPDRVVFASQAKTLDNLHRFDPVRFRVPWQSVRETGTRGEPVGMVAQRDGSAEQFLADIPGETPWLVGDCGQKFVLTPVDSVGVCESDVPPRFLALPNTMVKAPAGLWKTFAASEVEGLDDGVEAAREPACVSRLDRTTAEVMFLGTAGAIPGKYRNVSGIYLHLFGRGGMILDCGEGTWGQMTRAFGLEQARAYLKSLSIIYVSHIHADHHLGLITLLHEREAACAASADTISASSRLVVIGPAQLGNWLDGYYAALRGSDCLSPAALYKFCDAAQLREPQSSESQFLVESFGLQVSCVEVIHCPNSYGVVVKDRVKEWSVVYSGDTRPCAALAEAGRGATLAIHEATLDDSMEIEAVDKKHCTTSEALTVCGKWMGAWRTILTHFSQRYPLVPLLDRRTMAGLKENRAAIAFDLMRVNFADLAELPLIMPAVREAFAKDLPSLEPISDDDESSGTGPPSRTTIN